MEPPIFFSVIIPTLEREPALLRCLEALLLSAEGVQELGVEVIIADDSAQRVEQHYQSQFGPSLRVVPGPRLGPAANRNSGARAARGAWLVFVDDDCIPDQAFLRAYLKAIQESADTLVFEGKVYPNGERTSLAHCAPCNEKGGYLWSCNFCIRRDIFMELAGFSERFPYAAMEDVELRTRLQKQQLTFDFVPDAAVCHPWRERGGWTELRRHQKSTLIFLELHPEKRAEINSIYYLRLTCYGFLRDTLPKMLQGKWRGLHSQLLEYGSHLGMAIKLIWH